MLADTRNSLQLFVALCVALVLFTACSSDNSFEAPVFEASSPIEELLGVPIDPVNAAAWDDTLRTAGIEHCMSDRGHDDYQHDSTLVGISPNVTNPNGVPDIAPELATITGARSILDRVNERADTPPQETLDDLFGRPQVPGCLQEGDAAIATDPNRKAGLFAQFTAALDEAYASEPITLAAAGGWRTCMTAAGYDFESPAAAQWHFETAAGNTGALTDEEVANLDDDIDSVTERIIADLEPIAAEEAIVADESRRCALDWLQARAAVRSAVAADFLTRLG